jgi:hypothetical protein
MRKGENDVYPSPFKGHQTLEPSKDHQALEPSIGHQTLELPNRPLSWGLPSPPSFSFSLKTQI